MEMTSVSPPLIVKYSDTNYQKNGPYVTNLWNFDYEIMTFFFLNQTYVWISHL